MSPRTPDSDAPPADWRPVVGWEGYYEVNSTGQVRSVARSIRRSNGHVYRTAPRSMGEKPDKKGYIRVKLSRPGDRLDIHVHRLVADAFLDPAHTTETVNHIDGNKTNNHVSNLEWATLAENSRHCVTVLHPQVQFRPRPGEKNGRAKLNAAQVQKLRERYAAGGVTIAALACAYGVGPSAIYRAIRCDSWSHIK